MRPDYQGQIVFSRIDEQVYEGVTTFSDGHRGNVADTYACDVAIEGQARVIDWAETAWGKQYRLFQPHL